MVFIAIDTIQWSSKQCRSDKFNTAILQVGKNDGGTLRFDVSLNIMEKDIETRTAKFERKIRKDVRIEGAKVIHWEPKWC